MCIESDRLLTFPDKVGLRDAFLDLLFVCERCFRHEGAMQPWAEVVEALWVVPAEVEELCGGGDG
jgi:hypothetical protein